MDDQTRQAVLIALFEGIASARNAVAHEGLSPLDEAAIMADVALQSLEGAGFRVVRGGSDA
jgi:hypothetical protein